MKKNREKKKLRIDFSSKRQRIIAAVLAVLLLFLVVYGRPIIKLRIENKQLKQQNEELTKERSATAKELKNVHSKDYIKEQARKQLRLLDKDEKIFIFEEDQDEAED